MQDKIVANIQLKRSLLFWKSFLFLILFAFLAFASYLYLPRSNYYSHPYVARVRIEGFIEENRLIQEKILGLLEDKNVKAMVLNINSPGGTIVGGESLYNALRKFAEKKPTAVVMGGVAASGGYMASIAADYIVAHYGTITGSIGVIMQLPDLSGAAKKFGVGMQTVRSGNLKGGPSVFEKMQETERSAMQESLCVAYKYFESLVLERRNISDPEIIKKISTGKIFLGKQALESNLIDKIGSEEDAKEWIDAQLGSSLKIRDINFDRNKLNLPIKILKSDWKREIKNFYKRNSGIMAILPYYSAIGEPSSYID